MFAYPPAVLTALTFAALSVRAAPSSTSSPDVLPPPFSWRSQLTTRQLSSEECNQVCEGPTKEYYEGKGCSVPESLSTCCTDQFISDYVQCNVCRRNNDQNSPDYPGIQRTLNNWGTWCATNGRPVRMSYLPGQSPATSTPPPQTSSVTPERPPQTSALPVTTTPSPPDQTSSAPPTRTSESTSMASDPVTSTQTSSAGGETEGQGVGGTGLSDGAVVGGGAPRPTDQSLSEQQRTGNGARSILPGTTWGPREGSIQMAFAVPLALGAVLM